jgi:predicted RND superfamily exporter protein
MTLVTGIAVTLIIAVIALFFRSLLALPLVTISVFLASGVAFAIGRLAYGHLNAATSFLGSIIAGNGINYAIIYLARYRELRARGEQVENSLTLAAISCRGATWLAAFASGGAYAALLFTNFRGFSEFGLIGGVGMILCWVATFSVTPAAIAAIERWRARRSRATAVETPAAYDPVVFRAIGRIGERYPKLLIGLAAVLTVLLGVQVARYLKDPWEYDFSKLGSRSSADRGAGYWSVRADRVFASRGAPILVLANEMDQTLSLAAQIRERDRSLTGGRFVEQVVTIHDRLGGPPGVVRQKLELLAKIRAHIDRVYRRLEPDDRKIADEFRPPEYLRALTPADLPSLVRGQFSEGNGTIGTPVFLYLNRNVSQSRGENLLQIAEIVDGLRLPDGKIAESASRASIFAEMIRSMERDGPLCTLLALLAVLVAAVAVTGSAFPSVVIMIALSCGVVWTIGWAALSGIRLNFLNFVALPLTFGIGVDYAINLFERVRFSQWRVGVAVASVGGAVFLCSVTTMLGYGALLFADNRALQSFGHYAIRGEIACSAAALLVMPGALSLWIRRRERKRRR